MSSPLPFPLLIAAASPAIASPAATSLDYRSAVPAGGDDRRTTLGAGMHRDARAGIPGYDIESAWQTGRQAGMSVAARSVAAEASAAITAPRGPVVTLGVDAASGDRDDGDRLIQAFHVPVASSHGRGGTADVVGRVNGLAPRAHFAPGSFLRDSVPPATAPDLAFLATTLDF